VSNCRGPRACALVLATFGLAAGCGEEPREHEPHAETQAQLDPHHAASHREACVDDVTLSEDALARYGIAVEPVQAVTLTPKVSAPGHLALPQGAVARVGSPLSGRIVALPVRSGDAVARGDTLLVIESSDLVAAQSDYLQRRTVAVTTGPAVELARNALERARELHERVQGVALAEVQRREGELRSAERDHELARAAESAARNELALLGMSADAIHGLEQTGTVEPRLALTAPIAGRVVQMSATLGELVDPQKDRLIVLGDLGTLWAVAEVSESRLAEVALGATAVVTVPALANHSARGTVESIAAVLEASTRTAEVRVELDNERGAMLPGMFVQVEIESSLGAGAPVLALPDAAVLTIEGRPSVFVPLAPGASTFCKHAIEIGAPVGDMIPVLFGLEAGELVVVAGTFRLKAEHGKAAAEHEH